MFTIKTIVTIDGFGVIEQQFIETTKTRNYEV
jgi:hypothetical protein